MKTTINLLCSLVIIGLVNIPVTAQGLLIGSETTFSLGQATLYLSDNWKNEGIFNSDYGTIIFNGQNGNQTIESTGSETFSFLTVNKSSGDLQLLNNITVNGGVNIIKGDIDGNNNFLNLGSGLNGGSGSGAFFHETPGNTFKNGIITASGILNAPDETNFMGLIISSGADPGYTEISRGHYAQTGNNNIGIHRFYNVAFANRENLDVTLIFNYDDSELNGLVEEELVLFMSADEGETWTALGGTINTGTNTVTLEGIDSFPIDGNDSHTRFTLSSNSAPLPVELINFSALSEKNSVILSWQTSSEINNHGFEIERKTLSNSITQWSRIGFVKGFGTTTGIHSYSFIDKNPAGGGKFKYRLKQIDNNGSYKYSREIEAEVTPDIFSLSQNYPNPFNPVTNIKFSLPVNSEVRLDIYNIIGEHLTTLIDEEMEAGFYSVPFDAVNLPSGTYIYRITASDFSQTKKMLLIK